MPIPPNWPRDPAGKWISGQQAVPHIPPSKFLPAPAPIIDLLNSLSLLCPREAELEILAFLAAADRAYYATELVEFVNVSQRRVFRNLHKLHNAGLIRTVFDEEVWGSPKPPGAMHLPNCTYYVHNLAAEREAPQSSYA